jgi:hypothetical protein
MTDVSGRITKFVGRIVANSYYSMQEIRIATKNKLRDVIRKKVEGIDFDQVEDKKKDDEKTYEKKYKDEELFGLWDKLLEDKKITQKEYDYVKLCWDTANETQKIEKKFEKAMIDYISQEPVYQQFLSKIRGIGTVLSANLIKEFGDCSRFETPAHLWSYCGLSVVGGVAPKRVRGEVSSFNPRLRTLTWKISDCLMKSNKGLYRNIYDTEKVKHANRDFEKGELKEKYGRPYEDDETKLRPIHVHNIALRKMRKIFMANFWSASRELNGLPVREPYAIDKLGHKNAITWVKAIKMEKKMP